MKNFKESEVKDYIQEKYNPEEMPVIFYKELRVLQDFKKRGFDVKAGEVLKLGVYLYPKNDRMLNVFKLGHPTHYSVPAEVFFKVKDAYELKESLKKARNTVLFTVKNLKYRLVRNPQGYRELIREDYLDRAYIISMAAKKLHIDETGLTCVARIIAKEETHGVFWELSYTVNKKRKHHFFKLFVNQFQSNTYVHYDTEITIGTNQKTLTWKGTKFRFKNKKLIIGS